VALKLSFHDPAFPKDKEVDLGGVLVKNGGSVTLSENQETTLVSRHGMSVKDYFKGSEMVKVEGTTELSAKELEGVNK
jgi:hypothetical protein